MAPSDDMVRVGRHITPTSILLPKEHILRTHLRPPKKASTVPNCQARPQAAAAAAAAEMSSLFSCWGALSHCILPQDMHNHHDSINESSSLLYNHHNNNNNKKKRSSSSSVPLPHFSSDEPEKNHPPYPLPTRPTQKKEGWWCIEVQQKERGEEVLENDDDDDNDGGGERRRRRKEEKMKTKIKMKIKEKEKNKNKKVKAKKACDHSPSPLQLLHVPSSSPVLWPGGRSLELGEISRYAFFCFGLER